MYASREEIEALYEEENLIHLYHLKREQFIFLYRLAEGQTLTMISIELDKNERSLYRWKKIIQRKFKAGSFEQVMFIFGKLVS